MICKNCGTQLPEGSKFCGNCGKKVLSTNNKVKCTNCNNEYNSELGVCPFCGKTDFIKNNNDSAENDTIQPKKSVDINIPQPTKVEKSPKKGKVALSIVSSILLIIFSVTVRTVLRENQKQKEKQQILVNFNDIVNDSEEIEYTKGTLSDDGIYTNKWANIRLAVPEGYTEGNSVNYNSFSDGGTTECGLYLLSPQREMYAIAFIDASSQKYVNENTLLLQLSAGLSQQNNENVKYTIPENFEDIKIAGENYTVAHFKFSSYGIEFVQSYYVRKIGDRFCNIIIINSTKEENDALVSKITKVD